MLEYDDCTEEPTVKLENFKKQITLFAKKNNMMKDLTNII